MGGKKLSGSNEGYLTDNELVPQIKCVFPFKIEFAEDIRNIIKTLIPTYFSFWDYFFNNHEFLETKYEITIPSLIVGTNHRNYILPKGGLFSSKPEDVEFKSTGKTIDLPARLEEIASAWNIPLKIIDSWNQEY